MKRDLLIFVAVVLTFIHLLPVSAAGAATAGAVADGGNRGPRLVVLGFDGVDAKLTERWMGEGKLPHLAALARQGGYARLRPPIPAQTPVSWSTFTTGRDPGGTRIFDFLIRDPETYMPSFGVAREESRPFLWGGRNPLVLALALAVVGWLVGFVAARLVSRRAAWPVSIAVGLALGVAGWWIGAHWVPKEVPVVVNNRQGIPFWKVAGEHGVHAVVGRIPVTFPARPFPNGRLLSGLGVPDVRGRIGSPSYYTSDPFFELGADNEFSLEIVRLTKNKGTIQTYIAGPPNRLFRTPPRIDVPMTLHVAEDRSSLEIETCGQRVTVRPGEWSPWVSLKFPFNPIVAVHGMAKFRLLELDPEIKLYLTSIQFDPEHLPAGFLISSPRDWAASLKQEVGPFKTAGWAVDTWGVSEKVVDEDVFLEDVRQTVGAFRALLLRFLEGDERLLVHYFEFTDRVGHILFRFMDPEHPYYDAERAPRYQEAFMKSYQLMDDIVGEVESRLGPDDVLIVLSDHGFSSWRRSFNINTWLARNGYLALTGGEGKVQDLETLFDRGQFWPNVDWSRSRAYHLGLGGLFINLRGREAQGIVAPGRQYEELRRELARKLEALVDPETGVHPVRKVYLREEIYSSFDPRIVPDLFVTTEEGYRISWQSALGGMPKELFMDNARPWSGDHCTLNPDVVPGVLFANRSLERQRVDMLDVYPTILGLLGERPPEKVGGVPFLEVADAGSGG